MRIAGPFGLVAFCAIGCTPPPPPPDPPLYLPPQRPRCEGRYGELPEVRGQLGDARLGEVSGLAASLSNVGVLWAHNDSGDNAVLYALTSTGTLRATVPLPFVVSDVEDIAAASCPDRSGPCLYIFDTGNNAGTRSDAAVFVVHEPVIANDTGPLATLATATLVVRIDASTSAGLPSGIDVEAGVVAPDASALYVIEKVDADGARVFVREALDVEAGTFRQVGTLTSESAGVQFGKMITGADLHTTGAALVVRTYTGVFEHRVDDVSALLSLGDVQLQTVTFGPFSEPQGEAIAYDETGTAIITISEAAGRDPTTMPVNALVCQ